MEERLWLIPLSAARDPRLNAVAQVSMVTFPVTKKEVVNGGGQGEEQKIQNRF